MIRFGSEIFCVRNAAVQDRNQPGTSGGHHDGREGKASPRWQDAQFHGVVGRDLSRGLLLTSNSRLLVLLEVIVHESKDERRLLKVGSSANCAIPCQIQKAL